MPVEGGRRSVTVDAVEYAVLTYRPRTEGLFAKIERWIVKGSGDSYWRVISKTNVTSIYGASPQTRISDPAHPRRVFQWLLQETFDAKGNHILYEYKSENADEVADNPSEKNRSQTANKYLESIKYGNDRTLTPEEKARGKRAKALKQILWHFEVVFDYAESEPDPQLPYTPPSESTWTSCRKDSFSSYKSGFEIRTHRLCHRILMFHRFPHMNDGQPSLVSATRFEYDQQPTMTFLKSVTHVGYRDGVAKEMPPLEFDYTKVAPTERLTFKPLKLQSNDNASSGHSIPGMLENGGHQMVALYGEGLPGILYADDKAVLYWRPQGDGRFAPSAVPNPFPIERNLQNASYTLTDLEGNGILDFVVETPTRSGYYESHHDGSWEPFRSFAAAPTELLHPQRQMVDVTGDGRPDLLLFEGDAVKVYPSKGKGGYDPLQKQSAQSVLPVTSYPSECEVVHFADMFGDGGMHPVRIKNGSVECWPNLGYGRFGPKVELANAPRFDNEMDAKCLFLTDIDGSGATDLVYAHPTHDGAPARVDVYRNLSGNGFSEPESITLPHPFTDLSQINFADVLGNGTACLVFTSLNDDRSLAHEYVDFTGGVKPHLLAEVDNNMGATTCLHYSPSTKFYLADEQAGPPWITQLPFPVQVVEKIETVDHIGGSRLVASYTYHHGFFRSDRPRVPRLWQG